MQLDFLVCSICIFLSSSSVFVMLVFADVFQFQLKSTMNTWKCFILCFKLFHVSSVCECVPFFGLECRTTNNTNKKPTKIAYLYHICFFVVRLPIPCFRFLEIRIICSDMSLYKSIAQNMCCTYNYK